MRKNRSAAWLCFAAAAALLLAWGLGAYEVLEPAIRWNTVDATVGDVGVSSRHDGDGMLVFYVSARLQYTAAGQQIATEAGSDYGSSTFSHVQQRAQKLSSSARARAYWNPSNAKQVRFLLDYAGLLRPDRAGAALAAVLFFIVGMRVRNRVAGGKCVRCGMPVKAFYRFCPHCKTALHSTSIETDATKRRPEHPIA